MGAPYIDVMQHYFTDTANIVKYLQLKAESSVPAEEAKCVCENYLVIELFNDDISTAGIVAGQSLKL